MDVNTFNVFWDVSAVALSPFVKRMHTLDMEAHQIA